MPQPPSARRAALPAPGGITAHALVEARLSEIGTLRDQPGPDGAPALPARFLRHCDEQAVVGVHAVLRAIVARGHSAADAGGDGVVAASCQIGRLAAAKTLAGLATGGGVSVSPHIVPQCSLHSVAGAVSVGLGMHGPHLGIGGGADAFAEGLFAAATLLRSRDAGGPACVWLVATEWDDEPALADSGAPAGDPLCRGLALAIEADGPDAATHGDRARGKVSSPAATFRRAPATSASSLSLSLLVHDAPRPRDTARSPAGRLAEFARALDMCREGTALVQWAVECPWGAELRVAVRHPLARRAVAPARWREAA